MKLEVGKRYVLRNGEVTNPLRQHDEKLFTDGVEQWNVRGYCCFDEEECDHDIIAEYSDPDPSHDVQQPLRWVENCKPDKPGIWARKDYLKDVNIWHYTQKEIDTGVLDSATRCYLGPIPEILPPKKKVVERLWLKLISCEPCDCGRYKEAWFVDGETIQPPGDWIRTDRTREREI